MQFFTTSGGGGGGGGNDDCACQVLVTFSFSSLDSQFVQFVCGARCKLLSASEFVSLLNSVRPTIKSAARRVAGSFRGRAYSLFSTWAATAKIPRISHWAR
jgi:hypothetical protein